MAIWRMRIARWKPKATDIQPEYVILITISLHQWLQERPSVLRYTLPVLSNLCMRVRLNTDHKFCIKLSLNIRISCQELSEFKDFNESSNSVCALVYGVLYRVTCTYVGHFKSSAHCACAASRMMQSF
jgi:hypothetical protein